MQNTYDLTADEKSISPRRFMQIHIEYFNYSIVANICHIIE